MGTHASRRDRRPRRLGAYRNRAHVAREIVERPGAFGSRLIVDQPCRGGRDRRLVAHIGADEPAANAELVCADYLDSEPADGPRCRLLTAADLRAAPFAAGRLTPRFALDTQPILRARGGRDYRIEPVAGRLLIPELRWRRVGPRAGTVSLRDVVGDLQDYEPACTTTAGAVRGQAGAPVSTSTLAVELARVRSSAIVLNRGLREAVLAALERGDVSMSEIAMRCGRVKRSREPEMRSLPSGTSVCSLRVACNGARKTDDGYVERPNFFDVSVFGAPADAVSAYTHKGSRIAIDGRLEWREWETADNERRQAVSIVADSVQFLDSRADGERGDGFDDAGDDGELAGVGVDEPAL